jgi:hypothetical protein
MVALGVFAWLMLSGSSNRVRNLTFLAAASVAGLAAFYFAIPGIVEGLAETGVLTSGLFRSEFLAYLASSPGESVLANVGSLSALIRSPVSVAFFLSGPFMGFDEIVRDHVLRPRAVLTTVFALMSVLYMKYFVQGMIGAFAKRSGDTWLAVVVYLLLIVFLAHVSLVLRHKTMLMPLFYIIVAFGIVHRTKLGAPLGNAAAAALIGAQLVALMVW